ADDGSHCGAFTGGFRAREDSSKQLGRNGRKCLFCSAMPRTQGRFDDARRAEMTETMGVGRLEAFSDGVIAIIITIMVLELKVPHGADPWLLLGVWPVLLSYALSFLMVAIYSVNHHS